MKFTILLAPDMRHQMQVAAAKAGYNSACAWLRALILRELERVSGIPPR